jgi:hypothetical protein
MLDGPEPATDIKQRHPLQAFCLQLLDQEAGRRSCAMPAVFC